MQSSCEKTSLNSLGAAHRAEWGRQEMFMGDAGDGSTQESAGLYSLSERDAQNSYKKLDLR